MARPQAIIIAGASLPRATAFTRGEML